MEKENEKNEKLQNNLQELGIFQLRNLARQVGVKLPTTFKKAELIQKITEIVQGEKEPFFRKDKKGRPTKYPADINLLSSLDVDEKEAIIKPEAFHNISYPSIASFEAIKLTELKSDVKDVRTGYINVEREGFAVFFEVPQKSASPIYVKRELVAKYNLRDGDQVVVEVAKSVDSDLIVSTILDVKGIRKDGKFCNFLEQEKIPSTKPILWGEDALGKFYSSLIPAYCGDKILIKNTQKDIAYLANLDFLKRASESKDITDIVVLGINCAEEFVLELEKMPKVTCLTSLFGNDAKYQQFLVNLALKRAINLASIEGNNVLFVVLNLDTVLDLYSGEEYEQMLQTFKKFITFAKQTNSASLTVAYFAFNQSLIEKFDAVQNLMLEYLTLKYLTKSQIRYNLVNSFRQELAFSGLERLSLRQKVSAYLERTDDYASLANIIESCKDVQSIMQKLDN